MKRRRRPSDETMTPFLVRMPPELYAAVKATAAEEDRTMAQTVRRALRVYIDSVEEN